MNAASNPAHAVPPGEAGEVDLGSGVRGFVVRGARSGPTVWAWAPGRAHPSMAQALGEVRDRLDPRRLRGAVGFLVEGPAAPEEGRASFFAAPLAALSRGAQAVLLFEGMAAGFEVAPHVELDLADQPARKLARRLGAVYVAPRPRRLDGTILAAPTVTWVDGAAERFSRAVVDRAADALRSLFGALHMTEDERAVPPVRVVLKSVLPVEAEVAGLVEPLVMPGDVVRAGQVLAYAGAPGLRARRPLRAPATGVVLYVRPGTTDGAPVIGIGKLRRTLPLVEQAAARRPRMRSLEVGWCERVALPGLGVPRLKAKIDTGARTSALHVLGMRELAPGADGRMRLEIEIPAGRGGHTVTAEVAVSAVTRVRDSGGHAELRPVIETVLAIGDLERRVRVSLTDRGDMLFPMLVGRTALGTDVRVHPNRRWLLSRRR